MFRSSLLLSGKSDFSTTAGAGAGVGAGGATCGAGLGGALSTGFDAGGATAGCVYCTLSETAGFTGCPVMAATTGLIRFRRLAFGKVESLPSCVYWRFRQYAMGQVRHGRCLCL
jgi:hypothetical protein